MRAFIGEFDRLSLGVTLCGAAIGALWLVSVDLGVLAAALALTIGGVVLIVRHRWIEIALLMMSISGVVLLGDVVLGGPPVPPARVAGYHVAPVATETMARGVAVLVLIGGVALGLVVGTWDFAEARRRERLDRRHRGRRANWPARVDRES